MRVHLRLECLHGTRDTHCVWSHQTWYTFKVYYVPEGWGMSSGRGAASGHEASRERGVETDPSWDFRPPFPHPDGKHTRQEWGVGSHKKCFISWYSASGDRPQRQLGDNVHLTQLSERKGVGLRPHNNWVSRVGQTSFHNPSTACTKSYLIFSQPDW